MRESGESKAYQQITMPRHRATLKTQAHSFPMRIHITSRPRVRLQSHRAKVAVCDSVRRHGTYLSAFRIAAFPTRKASNSEPRQQRGAVTYVLLNGNRSEIRGSDSPQVPGAGVPVHSGVREMTVATRRLTCHTSASERERIRDRSASNNSASSIKEKYKIIIP